MHVFQFLCCLSLRKDIEIIEAPLPEPTNLHWTVPKFHLRRASLLRPAQQALRDGLFEGLHDYGGIRLLRLAEQEMNVLGHHHKPDHVEVVSTTNLLQRFQEHVTGASRSQKGLAPITTR